MADTQKIIEEKKEYIKEMVDSIEFDSQLDYLTTFIEGMFFRAKTEKEC